MTCSTALRAAALSVALLVLSRAANAQITVFTALAPFQQATGNRAIDSFNDLMQTSTGSPLNRTAGVYSYRAAAPGGFFPSGTATDTWLAADAATDIITLSNFSPTVRAVGGFFFGADINGAFLSGTNLVVTATSGAFTSTQPLSNTTMSTFIGFTSVGAFTTITISGVQSGSGTFVYASTNDLTLGTVVPEPASVVLLASGLIALGVVSRRRRNT